MPELQIGTRAEPCGAILFDKDGTLLHFLQMWGGWSSSVLSMLEQHLTVMGAEFIGGKERVLGTTLDREGHVIGYDVRGPLAMGTIDETIGLLAWQLYAAGVPWDEAVMQVRHFSQTAMADLRSSRPAQAFPGLSVFLEQCRAAGLKLGVVTSDSRREAEEHLRWLGFRHYFDSVIGYDDVREGKPSPEMVMKACAEMGVAPAETVVIGDSSGDMLMGKQAGVRLKLGFAPDSKLTEHLADADLIFHSYEHLKVRDLNEFNVMEADKR
ncbi:HAD family hydrolase [Paenibacillus sp. P96]|uniref:HAD family hydrolase n=1 Tax=Paenibacillus zeirhizosphaerae TaxID=2987519 RepID=A0ABT9FKJ1_9BACL|nr:HAD family hydrolase [Paenibacillus sp. P96]MDP4095239.1 HAD family hydrolase [Paenibacillus sp. P96]